MHRYCLYLFGLSLVWGGVAHGRVKLHPSQELRHQKYLHCVLLISFRFRSLCSISFNLYEEKIGEREKRRDRYQANGVTTDGTT